VCIAYYTRLPILFKEIFFYIKKIVLFKIVTEFFKCRGGDERCLRRVVRNIKRENRKSESYDLNFADGAEEVMNPSRCHSAFHPVILPCRCHSVFPPCHSERSEESRIERRDSSLRSEWHGRAGRACHSADTARQAGHVILLPPCHS